ncbi:hypothetical protein L6452_14385 [Arctium lappa]|uniref:Uncharacterized protein n=1 Tax=Arctium lappa TaxID=4217 RepID=A0ACB9CKU8_ARCLA|nr:hypothetical protein L6452_14385 [Arctium lappa]
MASGVEELGLGKSTVFINDVAFEVADGPFNVREAFGDDAVLINSYGQPVLTNEWGVTLQSLQHGAVYYLVRSFSFDHSSTIDMTTKRKGWLNHGIKGPESIADHIEVLFVHLISRFVPDMHEILAGMEES